jgi:uncharacterized membrane protein YkvA (DUF1232 family)
MDTFLLVLKYFAIILGLIILTFIVLVSLPNSKTRKSLLKIFATTSFIITIISALYVISPIDLIPDFIPAAGQNDDLVAAVSALATAISGYVSWQKSKEKLS